MADIRHCDRKGCDQTELCSGTAFLMMSHYYGHHQLQRYCSWGCLVAEATEHAATAAKEAKEKAETFRLWDEIRLPEWRQK